MFNYEHKLKRVTKTLTFYNEWDVNQEDVVDPEEASYKHIGKYIKFTDGSNLYAKIIGVSKKLIVTSACMLRRRELVHIAIPLLQQNIYGIPSNDEVNPAVRGYNIFERRKVDVFMNGNLGANMLTDRERLLVKEKLEQALTDLGTNAEWIAKRLKEEADKPNGRNFAFSLSAIAKQYSIDLTTPPDKQLENQNKTKALIGLLGRELENKALPTPKYITSLRDLKKIMDITGPNQEPEELVEVEAGTIRSRFETLKKSQPKNTTTQKVTEEELLSVVEELMEDNDD